MFDSLTDEQASELDPRDVEALDAEYEQQVADLEQAEYDAETEALDNRPQSNNKQKGENHE